MSTLSTDKQGSSRDDTRNGETSPRFEVAALESSSDSEESDEENSDNRGQRDYEMEGANPDQSRFSSNYVSSMQEPSFAFNSGEKMPLNEILEKTEGADELIKDFTKQIQFQ